MAEEKKTELKTEEKKTEEERKNQKPEDTAPGVPPTGAPTTPRTTYPKQELPSPRHPAQGPGPNDPQVGPTQKEKVKTEEYDPNNPVPPGTTKLWSLKDRRPPTQTPDDRRSYEEFLEIPEFDPNAQPEYTERVFVGPDFINVKTKGGEVKAYNGDVIVTAVDPDTGTVDQGVVTKLFFSKMGRGGYDELREKALKEIERAAWRDERGPVETKPTPMTERYFGEAPPEDLGTENRPVNETRGHVDPIKDRDKKEEVMTGKPK